MSVRQDVIGESDYLVGRKKHLSSDEKELISLMYRKSGKSVGAIAKFLDRSNRSVNRYKNYKLSKKTKNVYTKHIQKEIYDPSKEQALFQKMYDEYTGLEGDIKWFEREHWAVFKWISKKYWGKLYRLLQYNDMSKPEAIDDIIDTLEKKRLALV